MTELTQRLRNLTAIDLPYPDARVRGGTRAAEVLILFGSRSGDPARLSDLEVLFIHRSEGDDAHAGQMAFPGGACEADETEEPRSRAAVRETYEEVGIAREHIEVVGFLPELVSITGYQVLPVVGVLKSRIDSIALRIDPREIQAAVWIPWAHLSHPETYRRETIEVGPVRYPIHVFNYEDYRVWGLTGTLTKNLLDRWRILG